MSEDSKRVLAIVPLLCAEDKETTALVLFRFEMRKAHLQFKRIAEDHELMQGLMTGHASQNDHLDGQARLLADIHFLFVCIKKLRSLFLRMLEYFPEETKLKVIEKKYGNLLRYCGRIRNDLEHIEQRAEEGVECLGVTFGAYFQFGKKQIEIDPQLKGEIEAFSKEVDIVYDQILIAKRKLSGKQLVMLRSKITIPGGSETYRPKKDDKDGT
jgi:hypothetical protein